MSPRPTSPARVADLHLRSGGARVLARVRWPDREVLGFPPPVVVVLVTPTDSGAEQAADALLCDALCAGLGAVVISAPSPPDEAAADVLDWAADHARELGGDPERVLVAGRNQAAATATALAAAAGARGWPRLAGHILVVDHPHLRATQDHQQGSM